MNRTHAILVQVVGTMVRLCLELTSTKKRKFLVTEAATHVHLLQQVEQRLGVRCWQMQVKEVVIEDDADVATLREDDVVRV